jgi:hypothetical protein
MRSLLVKMLLGLVGSMIVVLSFAPAAGAMPAGNPDDVLGAGSEPNSALTQCVAPQDFTGSNLDTEALPDDDYLPLNRWGDGATGNLHSRLGGKFTDDTDQKIMRSFQGFMVSTGDSMWRVTGGLTEFATRFEILDQLGCTADRAAAGVGDAMLTGVAPLVVVAGIVVLVWRSAKGQEQPGKKAATMVLTLGAFAAMLSGAHATASSGHISAPSPAYLATTFNDTLTRVATAPTQALTSPNVAAYGNSGTATDSNALHCRNYVAALRARYLENGGAGSSVPIAVSAMWEQSGIPAYVAVQYGAKNTYGPRMYCHILERNAGITSGKQFALLKEAGTLGTGDALPGGSSEGDKVDEDGGPVSELFSGGNNKTEDQAGIFWAACRWTGSEWAVYEGWGPEGISDEGRQITPEKCSDVWENWDAEGAGLEWTDSPSQIHDKTVSSDSGAEVTDYLLVWHGDAYVGSFATAAVYVVASFVVMCVFGMIALGVIVSKILGIVMIVMIFLMMTLALFPGQGDNNKLAKFIKFWLGMTVFSTTLALILSLVALITGFVNAAGMEAFGQGSFLSILWLGFAPVTAVVLLHMVAKHAIGMPSPFKPSGALAWGAAAGATGAGLGVGLDRMARRGRGYGQSMVQGKMMRGRNRKGGDTRASGRDQQMPTGGRGGDTTGSEDPETTETPETPETPDTRTRRERASEAVRGLPRNAAAGARDIGASMNAWRKRIPTDAKNWAKNKPIRRVVVPAAVLAAAGVTGAASVLAAPAAPIVVGAIGARALWRRREGATGVVTGKRQADDGTWETRDDQRRRREAEYADSRLGEEPIVPNGEEPVVVRPAEGDGHSHPGGYL